MTKKMLIDAANPEEVRVCVLENKRVEDFDFESSSRKPLRGNIYLARVTRVEPSLQAAFVEYGGNRHGFLAFSEIHPDYYQIPVSDREALQRAEAEEAALAAQLNLAARDEDDDDDEDPDFETADVSESEIDENPSEVSAGAAEHTENGAIQDPDQEESYADDNTDETDLSADADQIDEEEEEEVVGDDDELEKAPDDENKEPNAAEENEETVAFEDAADENSPDSDDQSQLDDSADEVTAESEPIEALSDTESDESDEQSSVEEEDPNSRQALLERFKEARRNHMRLLRNYKIQEVIKRRQIILVQVVKEERGNKGAALTTYMSLAGRYCVLMPNTARGGGISRKIPNANDRSRLRRVVDSLGVAQGMGLIIRTAGAKRTKAEIKRDFDYLTRLWENIRSLTLKSIAPSLIYEEASLIKRAIRDLYDKDIDRVYVEGEDGYREAKDFMKMLMPSHAKNVQPYKGDAPLFLKFNVENQLDAMYQPVVRLKSGGYLVINQTEALIAIDVNSGKATRERNIEQTALNTNIEAAFETARQCRLRDLAGLLVIDFIDMEEHRNNRTVEKKLKEALKTDRARIQVGRISSFGLLEMSRQRRRSGIIDGTTHVCPTCNGAGAVRSNEMAALRILRGIEGEAISSRESVITVRAALDVVLYILNHKRAWLSRLEDTYGLTIDVFADSAKAGDQYEIEKSGAPREKPQKARHISADLADIEDAADADEEELAEAQGDDEINEDKPKRKRRRRRRKRGGDRTDAQSSEEGEEEPSDASAAAPEENTSEESEDGSDRPRRRRRGRRGGRRNARKRSEESNGAANEEAGSGQEDGDGKIEEKAASVESAEIAANAQTSDANEAVYESALDQISVSYSKPSPEPTFAASEAENGGDAAHEEHSQNDTGDALAVEAEPQPAAKPKKSRKGWWQRAIGG